jgi:hypothetical protein
MCGSQHVLLGAYGLGKDPNGCKVTPCKLNIQIT